MTKLVGCTSLPGYVQLISRIGVSKGSLGVLYASHHAAPDLVLALTGAMRYAKTGIRLNPRRFYSPLYSLSLYLPISILIILSL